MDAAVAGIVFGICLALCKVALLRAPALSISWAFTTITLVAFISAVPSFLLIAGVPSDGNEPELLPTFLIIPAWSVLASSMAYILDLWQSEAEGKLTVRIQELARENKLYEQKAWLARHGWYLVLHGVVQPALTTASIRATSSTELTPEVAKQIESDLQRALDALKQNTPAKLELAHEIHSIQELWKGICEVDVQVSSQVFDEIENRETTCQVLNEVLKEVVSNAVRHGQASNAAINIDLDSVGDIKIVAVNNGLRPLGNVIESLGSRMLDAVCVDRSLLWNEDSKLTEFKATIPLDNK
jgi:signal transduction histidine kinase